MPAGYWNPDTGQTEWNPNTPGFKRALDYYKSQQGMSPSNMAINQGKADIAGIGNALQINQAAVSAADPFASQRPQYQNALAQMMQGNFTPNDPSYQFRVGQGQQALERSAAAKGFLGSGNILQELQNYGQGTGSQEYQAQYQRLLPLTGATTGSPSAAGALQAGLYDWRNNALANIGGGMAAQQPMPFGGNSGGGGMTNEYKLVWA